MDQEQNALFVKIAQTGMASGHDHPIEWLIKYEESIIHSETHEKSEELTKKSRECYVQFYRGCGQKYEGMDSKELDKIINSYYSQGY